MKAPPPGTLGAFTDNDLSPEDFRRAGHAVVDWIADYYAHPERQRVLPDVLPGQLVDKLPSSAPQQGAAQEQILADFERLVAPHLVHWNHPGFMAYFAAGGSRPGVLADALAAAVNNVGLLWYSSPALAELEQVTTRWLAVAMGLPAEWFGMIHDCASIATFHAVIAARELAAAKARESGAELDLNRIVMYTSEQAHSSVEKAMSALGRGAEACRKIRCDHRYAMRPDELERAIARDRSAGLSPIAITATVGTTASTGIDPVPEIADIAAEHGLWLHVDAAYAGAAAILPEMRRHFAGCERADSFVINPHKWLFVQMDCSVFYTARPECLRSALSLTPEYLRSATSRAPQAQRSGPDGRAVNYMEHSIALGRRFRALKLWFVLRSFGTEHLSRVLREHIRLARLLAGWVAEAPDFELLAPVDFSLVCLRYRPDGASEAETDAANERLLRAVNATGEFFLSHAKLEGRYTIRVAIGNISTTEAHVSRLWEFLRSLAGR